MMILIYDLKALEESEFQIFVMDKEPKYYSFEIPDWFIPWEVR